MPCLTASVICVKRLSHLTGSEQRMEVGQYLLKTGNIRYMSIKLPVTSVESV